MENYNIGRFVPQCKPDGRFEEVQCGAGWKYCWCVDSAGTELPGTKTEGWPTCGKICQSVIVVMFCPFSYHNYLTENGVKK